MGICMLCSVQFKVVFMRSETPTCTPPCLSEISPMLPLKQFQQRQWPSRPFKEDHLATPLSSRRSMVWCSWLCTHVLSLAVLCYLHFWWNDQGCLCTTAVMLEWNRYQNKLTLENKILLSLLPFKPITFRSRVRHSSAEQLQRSIRVKHHVRSQVSLIFCLWHTSPHVGREEEEKKLNELER